MPPRASSRVKNFWSRYKPRAWSQTFRTVLPFRAKGSGEKNPRKIEKVKIMCLFGGGMSEGRSCLPHAEIGTGRWMWAAEAETPILWPPDAKSWLIGKDPDARKDWRQEEKGMTEDTMVGWHHWFNGHELEQTLGVGEGQGSLACSRLWGHKESDTTESLNWTGSWL